LDELEELIMIGGWIFGLEGLLMFDLSAVRGGEMALSELADGLGPQQLGDLTNEMIDAILGLIAECRDEDVVFVPYDPEAYDEYAADKADVNLAWTLGHVIVHVTASSEEAAFLAAELARGVPMRIRRSRYEVPWEEVTTIAQCRDRLEESRRMRLASLQMWPDEPHLDNFYIYRRSGEKVRAVNRFLYGLLHEDEHLGQIAEIVRQARAVRDALA
jgi:DinB superfamily